MRKPLKITLPTPLLLLLVVVYAFSVYHFSEDAPVALPKQDAPICLYSNQAGDDLRKTYLQAIQSANESIVLIIYSLTDNEIVAALKKKAADGVDVFVLCDPVATQDAHTKLGPNINVSARRQKGLMHNKLLAIDHSQAWLGSCNFTRDSLDLHANIIMGISSPYIASVIEQKAHDLKEKIAPLQIETKEQTLQLSFLPDDNKALDKVVQQVRSAKKTVKVAMFTFTHPELVQVLIDQHKKGVHVEVVMDRDSSKKTSSIAYKRFKRENMNVFVSKRIGLLHEKMAILDDTTLIMGSANWTRAAFSQNSENLSILTPLTQEQKTKLTKFWQTTLHESDIAKLEQK